MSGCMCARRSCGRPPIPGLVAEARLGPGANRLTDSAIVILFTTFATSLMLAISLSCDRQRDDASLRTQSRADSTLPVRTTVETSSPIVGNDRTLAQSLAIETLGGVLTPILSKGSTVPIEKVETFSTAEDLQDQITITLFRGDTRMVDSAQALGSWQIMHVPKLPRGRPNVAVTFRVEENGSVTLLAVDSESGRQLPIRKLSRK
jgi:Hsp70 protein